MKHRTFFVFYFILIAYSFAYSQSLKIPKIFSDHMVLQRDNPIKLWGWGDPGEEIQVELNGIQSTTLVPGDRKWHVFLPAMKFGGPYDLKISSGDESLKYSDVFIGDVWLASGQSNMEWQLSNVINGDKEVSSADFSMIRLFTVPKRISNQAEEDLEDGKWEVCTPETAKSFSAVAYFFGRSLHLEKNIPVGLINSSWGGTPAESWTSAEMLYSMGDFDSALNQIYADPDFSNTVTETEKINSARYEAASYSFKGIEAGVLERKYGDEDWSEIILPNDMPIYQITWFRKSFKIEKTKNDTKWILNLGRISRDPIIYLNGTEIGRTPGAKNTAINVPDKLIRKGNNTLTIRVVNSWNNEIYFMGPAEDMNLVDKVNAIRIPLDGNWKYNNQLEEIFPDKVVYYSHYPSVLFNGMINPIIPYSMKGAIWYQGESNAGRAFQYQTLFPKMIEDWRVRWKSGYFPFLFVQLANFEFGTDEPIESDWAELREAQLMTLDYPNTGMAVIIDLGEADDIHPRNKQDVGKRLYLVAKKVAYDEDLVYSGPIYKEMRISGNKIIIKFNHIGSGLTTPDDKELTGFAIAGSDKKFYWAKAEMINDEVVVYADEVDDPVAVRYGWDINPSCSLYNKEGLPASPFRTDSWRGITEK